MSGARADGRFASDHERSAVTTCQNPCAGCWCVEHMGRSGSQLGDHRFCLGPGAYFT